MEDALQPNAERADLVDSVLLRSADGRVQRLAILVRKRPVVCHQKRRSAEKTVSRIGPAVLQHRELEPSRTRVVRVLDQFPDQSASIPGIRVDVSQEGLDRLDLVERASDDAGVGPDINVEQALFVGAFLHETRNKPLDYRIFMDSTTSRGFQFAKVELPQEG